MSGDETGRLPIIRPSVKAGQTAGLRKEMDGTHETNRITGVLAGNCGG